MKAARHRQGEEMVAAPNKRRGMKINGYHVLGRYVDVDLRTHPRSRPHEIELHNAELQHVGERDNCAVLDIRTHDWRLKDEDGDPKILDLIEVYSPDIRFHADLGILVTGHIRICVQGGQWRNHHIHSGVITRRLVTFDIQPESALDDDGRWLKDRHP